MTSKEIERLAEATRIREYMNVDAQSFDLGFHAGIALQRRQAEPQPDEATMRKAMADFDAGRWQTPEQIIDELKAEQAAAGFEAWFADYRQMLVEGGSDDVLIDWVKIPLCAAWQAATQAAEARHENELEAIRKSFSHDLAQDIAIRAEAAALLENLMAEREQTAARVAEFRRLLGQWIESGDSDDDELDGYDVDAVLRTALMKFNQIFTSERPAEPKQCLSFSELEHRTERPPGEEHADG